MRLPTGLHILFLSAFDDTFKRDPTSQWNARLIDSALPVCSIYKPFAACKAGDTGIIV